MVASIALSPVIMNAINVNAGMEIFNIERHEAEIEEATRNQEIRRNNRLAMEKLFKLRGIKK
jgi:UDP:flavonoid glycosyltransferase YjiC (YdhE family)